MVGRVLVGRNIRRLRVECGLSQEALGYAARCEPSYVGRIERGGENVGVDLLEALAVALGVEIADLFALPVGELVPGLLPGRKARVRTVPAAPAPTSGTKATKPPAEPLPPASPVLDSDKAVEGTDGVLKPLANEVSEGGER